MAGLNTDFRSADLGAGRSLVAWENQVLPIGTGPRDILLQAVDWDGSTLPGWPPVAVRIHDRFPDSFELTKLTTGAFLAWTASRVDTGGVACAYLPIHLGSMPDTGQLLISDVFNVSLRAKIELCTAIGDRDVRLVLEDVYNGARGIRVLDVTLDETAGAAEIRSGWLPLGIGEIVQSAAAGASGSTALLLRRPLDDASMPCSGADSLDLVLIGGGAEAPVVQWRRLIESDAAPCTETRLIADGTGGWFVAWLANSSSSQVGPIIHLNRVLLTGELAQGWPSRGLIPLGEAGGGFQELAAMTSNMTSHECFLAIKESLLTFLMCFGPGGQLLPSWPPGGISLGQVFNGADLGVVTLAAAEKEGVCHVVWQERSHSVDVASLFYAMAPDPEGRSRIEPDQSAVLCPSDSVSILPEFQSAENGVLQLVWGQSHPTLGLRDIVHGRLDPTTGELNGPPRLRYESYSISNGVLTVRFGVSGPTDVPLSATWFFDGTEIGEVELIPLQGSRAVAKIENLAGRRMLKLAPVALNASGRRVAVADTVEIDLAQPIALASSSVVVSGRSAEFSVGGGFRGELVTSMFDAAGRRVLSVRQQKSEQVSRIQLPAPPAPGLYWLVVDASGFQARTRLIWTNVR